MLIPFNQLLADARAGGYAVGYFRRGTSTRWKPSLRRPRPKTRR